MMEETGLITWTADLYVRVKAINMDIFIYLIGKTLTTKKGKQQDPTSLWA